MRPSWFISLLKKNFRYRFILAKASRIPGIGALMSKMLFENDDLIYLPKNSVVELTLNQNIPFPDTVPLPSKIIHELIDQANFHWIMDFCICRESNKCKDYPRDLGCLFMGEAAKNIDPKLGHPATKEEAHKHIIRAEEVGLIHVIGRNKLDTVWLDVYPSNKLLTVCNCCPCCCLWKMLPNLNENISRKITKMEGIEIIISHDCIGCGKCKDVCFVNAIDIVNGKAIINDQCRGCGRCVEVCPNNAIAITPPTRAAIEDTLQRVRQNIDLN
ncbi:4Fe-4S binding protein [Candidatus Bathyarchaeota archaeon]|nr:4Fe-4S binding protein [Candidatus Bathyarchaeota archaeon]